jgi:hypothetical protein
MMYGVLCKLQAVNESSVIQVSVHEKTNFNLNTRQSFYLKPTFIIAEHSLGFRKFRSDHLNYVQEEDIFAGKRQKSVDLQKS